MYDPVGNPSGGARPPSNTPQTPFGNPFYGASSGLIRGGLGAYGEKILGSSSEYVQSNEKDLAAAAEKQTESQETIILLGKQLNGMRPQTEFMGSPLSQKGQTFVDEEVPMGTFLILSDQMTCVDELTGICGYQWWWGKGVTFYMSSRRM